MINFLPQIYENELLYSVIARYQRMTGIVSKRALVEDLFGRIIKYYSSLFPQYIQSFVDNLPLGSKITVKELIQNHTMYSFYTAFLSEKKANTVYQHMAYGNKGAKINPKQLIGLGGSKVRFQNI